jgi:EmrB/QacA subfamily drug resistance transporter
MQSAMEADVAVPRPDRRRWLTLALVVAAQFMVVLDIAIVNVALPSIKTNLHFSQESLQWVVTAYAIFFGGVLLLGGRLSDLLGRRRLFILGLTLFTVSSLLDGLAWSEASLITFRCLQGLGAALVSPAALSILTTTFAEGRERNLALGIWGAASGSGGAVGVLLGGALTSVNWSWIFFINVPLGALAVALSPRLLREGRAELRHRHFDLAGGASITVGLMLLVYAMTQATQHGWGTAETIGLLVGSAGLIVAFFLIELLSKAPLLPLRIFRLRTLSASNVAGLVVGGANFSALFLLTLYMQEVLRYSPIKTGVAYLGIAGAVVVLSGPTQTLVTRIGVRWVLPTGMALLSGALVLLARLPVQGHYFTDLLPALLMSGIGLALAFVSLSIGSLAGVRPGDAGMASGLINANLQIGGAIGVAVATTIATIFTSHYLRAHGASEAFSGAALTHGFDIAFYVLAAIAVLGTVLIATMLSRREPEAELELIPSEAPKEEAVA